MLGVVEVENRRRWSGSPDVSAATRSRPASRIPTTLDYLVEGNDLGGIDVGFLIKTAAVAAGIPRVGVVSVVQEGLTTTYIDPNDAGSIFLNDCPPLVADLVVHFADGRALPLTVIVNHLRSLTDVASVEPAGMGTVGARVRAKRAAQAEYLAGLVQARLTARPDERLVLVGDFNAFQFSDGLVDAIGTVKGTPAPTSEVVLASPDSATRTSSISWTRCRRPSATRSCSTATPRCSTTSSSARARSPASRASPSPAATPIRPRRRDAADAARLSDHDPLVAYFRAALPDVTAQIRFTRLPFVFNPFTKVSLSLLGVTNRGPSPIAGPIHLVFDDLAPGLRLLDASGAIDGDPFLTLNVPKLRPGETWVPLVRFANPGKVPVTFTPRALSGAF